MPSATTEAPDTTIYSDFCALLAKDPDASVPVSAVRALTFVVHRSNASTVLGLSIELRAAADELKKSASANKMLNTSMSLSAVCELYLRYVTRTSVNFSQVDISECKRELIERGQQFADISMKSRLTIAKVGRNFIRDGARVLTHANSRVVAELLESAAQTKNFSVVVTEGRPECSGYLTARKLMEKNIPVTIILDSAVAAVMEKIDVVVVGAEGVFENGGIVNKLGTYQIAVVAKAHDKPFYVAAESYKFARMFPLGQDDLPPSPQPFIPFSMASICVDATHHNGRVIAELPTGVDTCNPSSDLTPPSLISLLFTDLGVLTPSAVSDELIKLYQ